jgi:hypothetical protein
MERKKASPIGIDTHDLPNRRNMHEYAYIPAFVASTTQDEKDDLVDSRQM